MKHIESKTQIASVEWFRYQYPRVLISSFPNAGIRSKAAGGIMKAEGMTAGVPDLVILQPSALHHALFVEFKTETGTLSAAQKIVSEMLIGAGYAFVVCRSSDAFIAAVRLYFQGGNMQELSLAAKSPCTKKL